MSMLNDEVREQVVESLARLERPVLLRLFLRPEGCELCGETRELLQEVASLSPELTLEVLELEGDATLASRHGVDKAPALVVLAQEEAEGWQDYGVVFYGIPSGYEFTSLINSILVVSEGDSGLTSETREALDSLEHEVEIQVFVTPTCPYCPRAVTLAHRMAIESPRLRAAMVEAMEFPTLSMHHGVSGVPHSVINDQVHVVGAVPEPHLLAEVQRAALIR